MFNQPWRPWIMKYRILKRNIHSYTQKKRQRRLHLYTYSQTHLLKVLMHLFIDVMLNLFNDFLLRLVDAF